MSGAVHATARRPAAYAAPARAGSALPEAHRRAAEVRYGFDFGKVRIHADAWGDAATAELGANAFTLGHHVAFRAGRFAPGTPAGDRLLRHELAHVVQQSRGGPPPRPGGDPALEADASAAAGGAPVRAASGVGIACDGLADLGSTAGKYARHVTFPSLADYARSEAVQGEVQPDGSVHAIIWTKEPPPSLAPPAPAPKPRAAARPEPKPVPGPAPEPVSAARLREIAEALGPHLQYPKPTRQFFGALQAVGGAAEMAGGLLSSELGVGVPLALHGVDTFSSGVVTAWTGDASPTMVFRAGRLAASAATDDKRMQNSVGESFDLLGNIGTGALGFYAASAPLKLGQLQAMAPKGGPSGLLPPLAPLPAPLSVDAAWQARLMARVRVADPVPFTPSPITEGQYYDLLHRPGSPVSISMYGSNNMFEQGMVQPQSMRIGSSSLGYLQGNRWGTVSELAGREAQMTPHGIGDGPVPQFIREMKSNDALVWWEKGYMMDADRIHVWLTGLEGPEATPITALELDEILKDPTLFDKTVFHLRGSQYFPEDPHLPLMLTKRPRLR